MMQKRAICGYMNLKDSEIEGLMHFIGTENKKIRDEEHK
jgi:hypothetical protein